MSHENVDLFLRVADAINAREVPDALIAPDFHIENIVTAVSDKTYHGAAGAREWLSDTFDAFAEGARYEVEEIVADGDDFVVARIALVGSGARSGAPLQLRFVTAAWYSDGKAMRAASYANRHEALKAVGLEE